MREQPSLLSEDEMLLQLKHSAGTCSLISRHKAEDLGHIQQIWPEYEMCKEALLNLLEGHLGY